MAGPQTDPRAAATAGSAPPKRRGTELAMLGFAVFITIAAQCIVDITLTNSVRPQIAEFGIWISLLWTVAHLAVRRLAPYADPLLLPAVALLVGLGQAEIHRLDLGGSAAGGATGSADDAQTQLIWATLGVAVFLVVLVVVRDHRVLARFPYLLALVGMV